MLLLVFILPPVWGLGKAEAETKTALNKEWILSVAAFDISAMPPSRRIVGEVLASNLASALNALEHRIRIDPEYAYYQETAWAKARSEAGKKIAAKRDSRDLLLYQGNPQWRYKRELDKIDKELQQLEED
jgi:hypothetical protein